MTLPATDLRERVRRLPRMDRLLPALEGLPPTYLVGGAVRDLLLGRERTDIDVVIEGDVAALEGAPGFELERGGQFLPGKLQLEDSGLDIAGHNMGVAVADVNNDGWLDVLVTQYGGLRLFLNNGNGTFSDVTADAGLSNNAWGTSAAFFDSCCVSA